MVIRMTEKILVIGAHPDDETFGMGGTILKHTSNGNIVHVLIITDGSSSQYENYEEMIEEKKIEATNAMKTLGVEKIEFNILPDMKLDTIPHIEINEIIETKIYDFQPEIVYTQHWGDVNKDHRLVFESTIVAVRPTPSQVVHEVYTYETPSSTEWQAPRIEDVFTPNCYVDISEYLEQKMKAIECYKSEIRKYPHPRSPKAVAIYNKKNGITVGRRAAERFVLIREIK